MEEKQFLTAEIKDGRLVCPHCKAAMDKGMFELGHDEYEEDEEGDGFVYCEPVRTSATSTSDGKILDGKLLVDRSSTELNAPDQESYDVADYGTPYLEGNCCNEILEMPEGLGIEWHRG